MSNEEKRSIDLGPFFPKKPTATQPPRDDSAKEVGDMVSGQPNVGDNTIVPSAPPIEGVDDTKTQLPAGSR